MIDGSEDDTDAPAPASGEVANTAAETTAYEDADLDGEETETDTDSDEEFEEVERAGKTYRIPAALKGELMMNADYTKKTQEVAETRRELEARQAALVEQAGRVKALTEDHKRLAILDDYLERQSRVDWSQLFENEPLDAPRKHAEYMHWQQQRGALVGKVEAAERETAERSAAERAKRVQEGEAVLRRDIKGWSPELAQKIGQFAINQGIEPAFLHTLDNPAFVKVLHRAYIGDQLARKAQGTTKTPAQAAADEPVRPLTKVASGKSARVPNGPSDDMSAEDWVKARERQLRNSRK